MTYQMFFNVNRFKCYKAFTNGYLQSTVVSTLQLLSSREFLQDLFYLTRMAFEPMKALKTTMSPQKNSKLRGRKKAIDRNDILDTLRDYSSNSSIHGVPYLGNHEHSTCGRLFWIITVCVALACTLSQVFNLCHQWVDEPVVTTLETISLPVEQIDFPAVTLCPQGSTEDLIDNFFYLQFQEYLLNYIDNDNASPRRKRLTEETTACECHLKDQGNMTVDVLQCCFQYFLDEKFPGIYPNLPTKLATMQNTEDPGKAMETKSIVIQDETETCDENEKLETLNGMNEKLQRICPEPFQKLDDSNCIIRSADEMSYDEAFAYCKELDGANIFSLGSFEDQKTLDAIIGKIISKKNNSFCAINNNENFLHTILNIVF